MSPVFYIAVGALAMLGLEAAALVLLGFVVGVRAIKAARRAAVARVRAAVAAAPPSPAPPAPGVTRH